MFQNIYEPDKNIPSIPLLKESLSNNSLIKNTKYVIQSKYSYPTPYIGIAWGNFVWLEYMMPYFNVGNIRRDDDVETEILSGLFDQNRSGYYSDDDYYFYEWTEELIDRIRKLLPLQCSICHDTIPDGELKVTPCNHYFHKDCLSEWRRRSPHNTCPDCRGNLGNLGGGQRPKKITRSRVRPRSCKKLQRKSTRRRFKKLGRSRKYMRLCPGRKRSYYDGKR